MEEWNFETSFIAQNTINPIRKIIDCMNLVPNPEKPLIKLSIGDPTIQGNLRTSEVGINAMIESVRSGRYDGYPDSIGYKETREAVAGYVSKGAPRSVKAENVIITHGCSQAIELIISCLCSPGDNVLIPRPGFSLYKCISDGIQVECKDYNLLPEENWEVDLENMRSQIDDRTRLVIVNSPANPSGGVFSRKHMQEIIAVCRDAKIPLISDEVYEYVVYNGAAHHSFAHISTDVPVFVVSAISKRFLVPGWRLGWLYIHDPTDLIPPQVRDGLRCLTTTILGPSSITQGALPTLLRDTPESLFSETNQLYGINADVSFRLFSEAPGLKPARPSGAMYMLVGIEIGKFPGMKSDVDFTERLFTEQSVLCLPATCFKYPNYFRITLCLPTESMEEACTRIKEFCSQHYKP